MEKVLKICVGRTGHEIADKVAQSLVKGFGHYSDGNVFIGYGILRGMAESFRKYEHFFELDRGYFHPGHYDGCYRISYKGTQAKYDQAFDAPEYDIGLEPIRKYDKSKPVLVCPPTDAVCHFFGFKWWNPEKIEQKLLIRQKGDQSPIPWDDISAVLTFNSSVGWQAIQRGIPCLSDTANSVVGSYYNTDSLDELIEMFHTKPRKPLFDFMRAHQFTLAEIEQGLAWPLIKHYLSTSATTAEKPFAAMSLPTPFAAGLQNHFQSNILNIEN